MNWTHFHDMHSGGGQKLDWGHIYIEAPESEAKRIFYARFGRNAERITCTCCGHDYSISEGVSLAQLTGYDRGCRYLDTPRDPKTGLYKRPDDLYFKEHYYLEDDEEPREPYKVGGRSVPIFASGGYKTLGEYLKSPGVLAIPASEIKPEWLAAEVPVQGYVWVD